MSKRCPPYRLKIKFDDYLVIHETAESFDELERIFKRSRGKFV